MADNKLDYSLPTVNLTCDTGTIPNTNANMKIVYYNQSDYDSVPYGANGVSGSGCAICSFAMALCYVTLVVWTPDSLLDYFQSTFGSRELFYDWSNGGSGTKVGEMVSTSIPLIAKDFPALNISYKSLGKEESAKNQVINELKAGHPVIMSCQNPGYEGNTTYRLRWAGGKHIVLLSGIDSYGNIYCHNCGKRALIGEPYNMDEIHSIVYNGYWAIICNPSGTASSNIAVCNKSMGANAGKSAYTGGAVSSAQVSSSSSSNKNFLNQIWDGITNAVDTVADWAKGLVNNTFSYSVQQSTYEYEYATKAITYTTLVYKSANQTEDVQNTGLLTYPTLVESPFVLLKVGDYTFGTYMATASGKRVKYPNYIDSMTVKKVNGTVNQYTINLFHQIEAGADPNFVEKIFSSVGYGAEVYISYGDYNAPSMIYREEAAILQKVTSLVDFKSSKISYTVSCTSNATKLYATKFLFPKSSGAVKPSDLIYQMLWGSGESIYGLKDVFPGMYTRGEDGSASNYGNRTKFIASDDKAVEIAEKKSMDPISYINYLVTCMCSMSNTDDSSVLKDSTYKFCLYDTNFSSDGDAGAYFKIVKIPTSTSGATTLLNKDIYEVDIGYPTDSMVMDFRIKTDQSWAMLYKYADATREMQYIVDEDGKLNESYVPSVALSTVSGTMTESQRTWWTNMTRFPILAELELKGLVRPAVLMSYVRINALFYGQRHISSGLYYISAQTDSISGNGYRTTLSLTRIAGDDDVVETVEKTKDVKYVKTVKKIETEVTGSIAVNLGLFSNGTESAAQYQYEGTSSTGTVGVGASYGGVATNYSITIDPKTVNGSSTALGPDLYPIYAALRVATQRSDKTTLMYALSAALCRINDYKQASYPNLRLYEFIHMNKKVLASYANDSNPHYNVNLYNQYKEVCMPESNTAAQKENDIFDQNAAYAYDAANTKLVHCANQREKLVVIKEPIVYLDTAGIEVTLPPPSGEVLNALYSIISSGTVCTIANYFSVNFNTLSLDSDDTISLGSNAEINANRNIEKYWQPGDTYLIDAKTGVSGYFLEFPDDECNIPFIVQKDLWGDRGDLSASSRLLTSGSSGDWQADAWRLFRASGMTPQGAAGALGNMMHESAGNGSTSVEISGFSDALVKYHKYNWNSQSDVNTGITRLIDTGEIMGNATQPSDPTNKFLFRKAWFDEGESFTNTYWGYGLCQWTDLDRKYGLYNFAKLRGTSIGDILTQINYVIYELSPEGAYHSLLSELKYITDVDLAAKLFFAKYEFNASSYDVVPAEYLSSLESRASKAQEAYAKYSKLG